MIPSVVLYAIAVALAILLAACVVLAYILTAQPAARPAAPPPAAPPPQKQQAAGSGETGGSQKPQRGAGAAAPSEAREPQITDVKVYTFTPEVLRKCGVGSAAWYYYFNITVERFTAGDPVYPTHFRALTPEGPGDLNYPSHPAILEEYYFPRYNESSLNRTGVINVYAGLQSSVQLDITYIEYRGRQYRISDSNKFFVVCIGKGILLKTDNTILRPLHTPRWSLGLLPADRRYTIVVYLPRGRYEVRGPSGVAVEQQVVEGGRNVTVVLRFDNKPLAYDELVIEFRKAG
jgi:hypothetical protein